MLDPQTYRASEQLAKSLIPSWRVSQIHNVDHFERSGFPVRIGSIRELGQIVDTMQENRFDHYMSELGGLTTNEWEAVLRACKEAVRFQLTYLPHRLPILPISTLISAFALYKKMLGANSRFESVLEIGPGCGYVSFFLRHHSPLADYSQVEACESFYILQNLINVFCFGYRFDERALPHEDTPAVDYFVKQRPDTEFSPPVRMSSAPPIATHYPWWRIGELASRDRRFDIVTSNANLLEFNAPALDDYLSLLQRCLKPEGVFLVQCTGFNASGTLDLLLQKLFDARFAPLMFVLEQTPVQFPDVKGHSGVLERLAAAAQDAVTFTTNNALFIKPGHPLFEKYYERKFYQTHFVANEPVVRDAFFSRPPERKLYTIADFVEATEQALQNADRSASTP